MENMAMKTSRRSGWSVFELTVAVLILTLIVNLTYPWFSKLMLFFGSVQSSQTNAIVTRAWIDQIREDARDARQWHVQDGSMIATSSSGETIEWFQKESMLARAVTPVAGRSSEAWFKLPPMTTWTVQALESRLIEIRMQPNIDPNQQALQTNSPLFHEPPLDIASKMTVLVAFAIDQTTEPDEVDAP
jgi:hypothetical protein